jgi:hypothetical protein
MAIRRIVTSACVLCFAIPAAANAAQGTDPPTPQGPYGIPVTGPPVTAKVKRPYGVTPATGAPITAKVKGPYGVTPPSGAPITAKVSRPYGVTPASASSITAGGTAHASAATSGDDTPGWRIVALSEAALLAALALGAAHLAPGRHRAPHPGT